MIIDLRTILHEPRDFKLTFGAGWWQGFEENDQILGLDSPLEVHIRITAAVGMYELDGHLSGGFRILCNRCLEPYHRDLESDFRLLLAFPPSDMDQSELELTEEDLSVDFITGGEVDLDDIVRGQIYLSLPMKSLCREECSGLCPVCGSNLNIDRCNCQREGEHSGFSKLKDLKLKGEQI
ncbi:MAG TPA: DUF177 domain-containing protein [Acidobacteriota bacterium]|nr:DUF177 domain-containing protein [Acidobacteriota bacterium]